LRKRRKHSHTGYHVPENIDEFAELLARSEITTVPQADEYVAQFRAEHPTAGDTSDAITEFCRFLNSDGLVTAWQCEKLKLGRWKGFYLDNYLLLEQVGKGEDNASYKARETTSGNVVCLVIKAVRFTEGRITYRVEPYSEK
jgi:hypothetical protein